MFEDECATPSQVPGQTLSSMQRVQQTNAREDCAHCARPISLQISSLLSLLDSNFPAKSLWAWEFHPSNLISCLSQTLRNPESQYGDWPLIPIPLRRLSRSNAVATNRRCDVSVVRSRSLRRSPPVYIPQRGVLWKKGVVIYLTLYTSLLHNTTPIHCTPDPLHPPLQSIKSQAPLPPGRCLREPPRSPAPPPPRSSRGRLYIYIYMYIYIVHIYIYIYIHLFIYTASLRSTPRT